MWKAFLITLFLSLAPITTFAAGLVPCGGPGEQECQACHVVQLAQSGINTLIVLLTIIVTLILVIAGLRLVTSAGEASAKEAAKKMITNGLIGYVIVLVAWLLVDLGMKTLVNESDYGVWNEIQCVNQPVATKPPEHIRPPREPRTDAGTTLGVAGIPTSGTPSTSCNNCSSAPTNWPATQTIPDDSGAGTDTTLGSLCQTDLAPNGQCQISNDLLPELILFHNAVGTGFWVNEAWPPTGWSSTNPTGIHTHSCFSNGSCVKYSPVAGNVADVRTINTIIAFAHQYGLLAIYEVRNQAEKDFLVSGGVSANSIQVTGTERAHFTIYIAPAQTSPGGSGLPPTSGLPGYCGEYYNGNTRSAPTDPAFTAYGLQKVEQTWDEIVAGAINQRISLPGYFNESQGQYLAISFKFSPQDRAVSFRWIDAQGTGVRTTPISVSISPCPGDFRARSFNPPANDRYLSGSCGVNSVGISGGIIATTEGSDLAGCQIPVGKTFYLNITTHNMYSGYPEPLCPSGACGVNFTTFENTTGQ